MHPLAYPTSKVVGMDDETLLKWVKEVCPGVKFGVKDVDRVRKMIREKYMPVAEMSLKQPFPKNFGLDSKGKPDATLSSFLKSKKQKQELFTRMTRFFADPKLVGHVLDTLVGEKISCSATLYLVTHTHREVTEMDLVYENELLENERVFHFTDGFLIDSSIYEGTKLTETVVKGLSKLNGEFSKALKKCRKDGYSYINVSIAYFVRRIAGLEDLVSGWRSGLVSHATRVLIDLRTTPIMLRLMESSMGSGDEYEEWQSFLKEDLEVILSSALGEEARFSQDFDTCTSLQGESGLCATWSVYLLLLTLLNPDVKSVRKVLSRYTQRDRDRLILRFGYFMKKYVKDIKGVSGRGDRVIPEW